MRNKFATLSRALVALALAHSASAAVAQDTPPADGPAFVQRCVEEIAAATHATVERIQSATQQGARRIVALADQGAPKPVLVNSARRSVEQINTIARAGVGHVNFIAGMCLQILDERGAPDDAKAIVRNARARAVERIAAVRGRALEIIRDTLERATMTQSELVQPL